MASLVHVQLTLLALHALLVQAVDHRAAVIAVGWPYEMMLFELVRCIDSNRLVRLVEKRHLHALAFRFHLVVAAFVHHRIATQTAVALQTDAEDELVTVRTVAGLL